MYLPSQNCNLFYRYGKMLALSCQHNKTVPNLTQHAITMVAALSLQEVLLETPIGNHQDAFNKKDLAEIRHKWASKGKATRLLGDPMVLLSAVYSTEYNGCTREFCDRHGLRFKAMQEIRKLRRQLANELSSSNFKVLLDPKALAPNDEEAFSNTDFCFGEEYFGREDKRKSDEQW